MLFNSRRCSSAWIHALLCCSSLEYPLSGFLKSHQCTLVCSVTSMLNSTIRTPHTTPLAALPREYGSSSILVGAPQPRYFTAQSPSALFGLDLALFSILRSFNTICVLVYSTQHSPSGPLCFNWLLLPIFIGLIIAFQTPIHIRSLLRSQYTIVRYHKSRQRTLEFNFFHSPGTNIQHIQGAPPASFHHASIVCSCFRVT